MALINCPECNKEISDKAVSCPNCGYPIQEVNKPKFSSTGYNVCPKCGYITDKVEKCQYCGTEMVDCHTSSQDYFKMFVDQRWQWKQEMYNKYVVNSSEFDRDLFNKRFQEEKSKYDYYASIPRRPSEPKVTCPYCKSTNTKKISSMAKATNIALFGIFGNKRKYQWHCNNCNSDF